MSVRWCRRLLWFVGFGCLCIPVLDDPPLTMEPFVQDVTADAATIALILPRPARITATLRTLDGAVVAGQQSAGGRRRHALRFEGLAPATVYRYSVETPDGLGSNEGTVQTAPTRDDQAVRFAFVGDSGDAAWWAAVQRMPIVHWPARLAWLPDDFEVTAVGEAIARYAPDFVLHLGDVVYPWGRNAEWPGAFVRPFAAVMRDRPLYAVLGNHDLLDCRGVQLLTNLSAPANSETGDGRCFSFAWGSVRIIGLDCNRHYDANHPAARFLAREIAACAEPWIIVASHFPIRSQSRQRDRADLLLALLPVLEEHAVSVYLSGHDHCYQRFAATEETGVAMLVSGGGGKSLYDVRPGREATVESSYHWCSGVAEGSRLVLQSHRLDGSLIESAELQLPRGEALDRLRTVNPRRAARVAALRGG